MTTDSATPPVTAAATRSTGRAWAGRAWEVGLRVGGLAFAIIIVIAIFALVSKPNTFLTVTNSHGDPARDEHDRDRRARACCS